MTDYDQIELPPFCCHYWGGGEGEKDVSRVCAVGTEAQLASVCVCVFERGVDRLLSRSMCHPTPSVPGSVCVCMFEREASR